MFGTDSRETNSEALNQEMDAVGSPVPEDNLQQQKGA
jgi:hypothetical protein